MTDFWRERVVFVTGAAGIVGSWLVNSLLDQGARVIGLVRNNDPQSELFRSGDIKKISVVSGSLDDIWSLERVISKYEIDTVFHLAAQPLVGVAHRFPLQTFEANIRGTYNLLEVCRIHQRLVKRIVVASSDKAYGTQPNLPYTEDMPLQGRHPYEVSKSCTDLLAQTYYHTYNLRLAIARCGNIYGGGDLNWSRIVPGTIRSFLQGQSPIIRSDGKFVRDYIYVNDVVRAYICLAEQLDQDQVCGEAFNFSPENPMTVFELVAAIQRLMACDHIPPDVQNTAQGEIRSQYLSAAKARTILKWQPHFSLDEGLQETITWYREYMGRGVKFDD